MKDVWAREQLDGLSRRVGMIAADAASAVEDAIKPILQQMNDAVNKFNAAAAMFNDRTDYLVNVEERLSAIEKQLEEGDVSSEVIASELNEIRESIAATKDDVARIAASNANIVQTFKRLGQTA